MNTPKQTLVAFDLDDQRYGLHLEQVQRIVRAALPTELPGGPGIVMGVLDVQGQLAPIINIRRRFGRPDRDLTPDDHYIIARTRERPVVLPADRVRGVVECTAASIPTENLTKSPLVEGVVQLEDGLLLIHDLEQFLTPAEGRQVDRAVADARGRENARD